MTGKPRAVLDRDGTIVVERHYLSDPEELELLPGAAAALRRLSQIGLGLVVITNQSAVGRGILNTERLETIHARLRKILAEENVTLDGIYFCPHLPEDDCPCRKPKTALLEQAARELDFDPAESFVIGDKECDVELGRRVGATTLLVRTGYGNDLAHDASVRPDHVVADLSEGARVVEGLLRGRMLADAAARGKS
jgi:D-glycero-D-manno-heptose 1,7-bisphosphate phosphatase